ncbi:flagellin [Halanaerobiaceae bacterium Z-7014]|uniref:Flagellin n=1 Tax=Halonatronomonas betaini TaxID=2778430 RepID=A0A931AZX4_9FIRM|nr:flagellin [Halonatronomonas betaini]MBF8437858.1 flagellin [Halonatronomonas betaini]
MRIQTNVESLNAYRNLNNTNRSMSQSMERLSSGFRINRAADDAAGLAISEKMRGQVRGLDQATRNAQDANSMIQTAEGALNETHEILQRMRELSVQAANDTNTAEDRAEIQAEVDQLAQEITRIGDNTEFNTQNLLDGSLDNIFQIGANEGQNIELEVGDMRAESLDVDGNIFVSDETDVSDTDVTVSARGEGIDENTDISFEGDGDEVDGIVVSGTGDDLTITIEENLDVTSEEVNQAISDFFAEEEIDDVSYDVSFDGNLSLDDDTEVGIALDEEEFEGGILVSTQGSADSAISTLDAAIEEVSSQRSELGAVQNRLDHTIANLEVASENLQAAESRIRDVDMADEMTEFSKQQILEQAGTAMLAQANQASQSVLQLLG